MHIIYVLARIVKTLTRTAMWVTCLPRAAWVTSMTCVLSLFKKKNALRDMPERELWSMALLFPSLVKSLPFIITWKSCDTLGQKQENTRQRKFTGLWVHCLWLYFFKASVNFTVTWIYLKQFRTSVFKTSCEQCGEFNTFCVYFVLKDTSITFLHSSVREWGFKVFCA